MLFKPGDSQMAGQQKGTEGNQLGEFPILMFQSSTAVPHIFTLINTLSIGSCRIFLSSPLGRIHLTPKNGGYMGENGDFRAGGHWEKLRSSETKRATTDRLVPKRPQFWWLRSPTFWFFRRGPQKGLFGPFLGPRGPGVNFFPNIGKWGIQSGATICPDHTALFRSI